MNLAIRLQNHGKKNHPLWWIVVAPRKRNIRGRFIEHVGYWSPRTGVNLQRQVILNMPRVKYWMSCGAVPTYRIHRFLAMWGVLPKPWYYKKSEEEMEKLKKPEEQLNEKQKRKLELKRRRKQRQFLTPNNFMKVEAKQRHLLKGYMRQLENMKRSLERENQIIRELLLYNQFEKTVKINELTGKSTYSDTQQLKQLKQSLEKAKSELYLIQHNYEYSSPVQQSKVMRQINTLCKKIRQIEQKSLNVADLRVFAEQEQNSEFMTEDMLNAKLQYELIHKKLQKLEVDLQQYERQSEPVLLEEYADFLVSKQNFTPQKALIQAQKQFIQRGRDGIMMTKYDLINYKSFQNDEFSLDQNEDEEEQQFEEGEEVDNDMSVGHFLRKIIKTRQVILPSRRPVHPLPDLTTYIPQEYYEPIANHNTNITLQDPLIAYEQLQKYKQKKVKGKKSDQVV